MAYADKDVLITPNTGSTTDEPKIEIVGADASGSDTITIAGSYNGTTSAVSFEGSAGQLFSVSNVDSDGNGYLFTVNDKSGIPSLQVETDGTVILNPNTGNVLVGTATDDGVNLLQVDGSVSISGTLNVSGNQTFADNEVLNFGNSNDLQIYHGGNHSFISDQGTGNLKILADSLVMKNAADTQNYVTGTSGGAAALFYAGSEKLTTTSTGIDVTGDVRLDDHIYFDDPSNDTIITASQAIRAATVGLEVDTQGSFIVNIDTNNNQTDQIFAVRSNSGTANLFSVDELGNGIFSGSLSVAGTLTTINTTDLAITDNIIVLNKDEAGAGVGGGSGTSGLEVERGTAGNIQWVFDETSDHWRPSSGIGIHTTGNLTQTNGAPVFVQTETGVTNTPAWWIVSDGGNWSVRLNNTGPYPITVVTNATNDSITVIDLGYDVDVDGTITAGDTSGTVGEVILRADYTNGNIATWGSMFSSGGPFMGYGTAPSTTVGNAFISTSAGNLERAAYWLDGYDHRWMGAAGQTTAIGNAITSPTAAMHLDALNGNLTVSNNVTASSFTANNDVNIINATLWYVSGSDNAHQRADARDDATNYSRLHWYGATDASATSNFRHAWYDGNDYMHVDVFQNNRYGTANDTTELVFDPVAGAGSKHLLMNLQVADAYNAKLFVGGNGQATGIVEVGQSIGYSGGMFYNGDGTPAYATDESSDNICFYRVNAGARQVVMKYGYSTNDVWFKEDITVIGDVVTNFSDQRLKNIDSKVTDAVTKVKALNGYLYTYNDKAKEVGYEGDQKHIGVIAQEVQAVVPEAVTLAAFDRDSHDKTKSASGEDYLTVKYERLVPLLIEAIKEQAATIEALEERINKLEKPA